MLFLLIGQTMRYALVIALNFSASLSVCADVFNSLKKSSSLNSDACHSFDVNRQNYLKELIDQKNSDNRFFEYQGLIIDSIEFVRVDVFDKEDPKENNFLFQLVNKLHLRTRQSALLPQLQFAEGQRLDPASIAETERNLRARSYLSDAYIMPIAYCNGRVRLLVVTKDAWTTQPIVVASREGGSNKSRTGLVEGNFAGTGAEVSILVTHEQERRSIAYAYKKDYILSRPLEFSFGYSDNSDGYGREISFGKPFYFNDTPTSFDASFSQIKADVSIVQNEKVIAKYNSDAQNDTVYGALRIYGHANYIGRIYGGITQHSVNYDFYQGADSLKPKINTDVTYPWMAFERTSTKFIVMRNIQTVEAVEDFRVGSYWWASFGYAPNFMNDETALLFNGIYQNRYVNRNSIVNIAATANFVDYQQLNLESFYSVNASADYLYFLGDRRRFYARGFYQRVNVNAVHDALSLGGALGVRGYPAFYVVGDEAAGGSFELRYHAPWYIFNLIRLGFAAYIDAAVINDGQYGLLNNNYSHEVLSGVGAGVRLTSTKTQVGNILHLDFAMPTGYQVNAPRYQILIRAEKHF